MANIYASKCSDIEAREIENKKLARKMAGECVVLLENNGVLPFADVKKIALFGAGVRGTIKGGTGSGDVNSRDVVNIEQGFKNAGFEVASLDWLNRQDERVKNAKNEYRVQCEKKAAEAGVPVFLIGFDFPYVEPAPELITEADVANSDCDTAVYVISRNSGEGADRFDKEGDYQLYKEEKDNIEFLIKGFKNVIVVLNIGGVMNLSELKAMEGISAVVLMTQLGNIGGDALLDILTGAVNPSGKLVDTWAKNYMDYPSSAKFSHNESVHEEVYEDNIYIGYRYFDSFEVKPLYPFGYGLSYTTFEIYDEKAVVEKDTIKVSVKVKNTGKYAGKEVVQVYYSSPAVKIDTPYQELIAFKKTSCIKPGEEEIVEISFKANNMASYYEKEASWILEPGKYAIRVGSCSADTKVCALVEIENEIVTEKSKNVFPQDIDFESIVPDAKIVADKKAVGIDGVSVIKIDASDIKTVVNDYSGERKELPEYGEHLVTVDDIKAGRSTVEELVSQLTVEEMADLCVGTQRALDSSVLGNASNMVPGAAGDSSSIIFSSRGLENMILADGPAGLRLQPHFKTDKEGNILPGGNILGEFAEPFDPKYDETNSVDYYQYCTAIPIGWALAQSWNEELITEIGDMVGGEMEQFHVDLWLAPAQNIHRNPLCGRNFEYYSEDPLVTGKTSAAITNGVQKHKGKGTTIKHFAANNQEDNRYFVNAHIKERALREIYLKGFEIAVKESQPLSIMTSYNLLNGTHTANNYGLIQSAARDEWGFKGVIMTDWCTTMDMPFLTGKFTPHYPISASTGCIFAGNDMQMPGDQKNVDDIIEAVKSGKELDGYKITKADLQFCACNVVRIAIECMQ